MRGRVGDRPLRVVLNLQEMKDRLAGGEVIAVPNGPVTDHLRRWARRRGYTFHKRRITQATARAWVESEQVLADNVLDPTTYKEDRT